MVLVVVGMYLCAGDCVYVCVCVWCVYFCVLPVCVLCFCIQCFCALFSVCFCDMFVSVGSFLWLCDGMLVVCVSYCLWMICVVCVFV